MKMQTRHFLTAFVVAVCTLNFGEVSKAADEETNPYDGVTQEMFDKCIKTDIFETNRSLGYSEYQQGNNGTVTLKTLVHTDVGTLDYIFDPQQKRLLYKLTSHMNVIGVKGRILSGIGDTVSECKKRCASGC